MGESEGVPLDPFDTCSPAPPQHYKQTPNAGAATAAANHNRSRGRGGVLPRWALKNQSDVPEAGRMRPTRSRGCTLSPPWTTHSAAPGFQGALGAERGRPGQPAGALLREDGGAGRADPYTPASVRAGLRRRRRRRGRRGPRGRRYLHGACALQGWRTGRSCSREGGPEPWAALSQPTHGPFLDEEGRQESLAFRFAVYSCNIPSPLPKSQMKQLDLASCLLAMWNSQAERKHFSTTE
nr:uncharacterized protein LOC121830569 [Peromyscus maniculatus bairdii]